MKIPVAAGLNPVEVIKRAGYGLVNDRNAREISYARRLGTGFYPRFHIYISGQTINLHLDQKQASYEGFSAHSGEYDGDAVEAEGARILTVMDQLAEQTAETAAVQPAGEKRGFFSRFFGD